MWLREVRTVARAHLSDASIEGLRASWRSANCRFDDWFNEWWPRFARDARGRVRELPQRLRAVRARPGRSVSLDTPAAVLLGVGAGSALQGFPFLGGFLLLWGTVRVTRRSVLRSIDERNMEGLFLWAPERRRAQIFAWLSREVEVARAILAGDPKYCVSARGDPNHAQAMDPTFDYTPESLFVDAMASVEAHPRVREVLGRDVRPWRSLTR